MNIRKIERKLIIFSLFLFLFFECFAGPLRLIFHTVNAEFLFSIPKLIIIITLLFSVVVCVYERKITKNGLIATIIIFYTIVISLVSSNVSSMLVGWWAIIPVFLGYCSAQVIIGDIEYKKSNKYVSWIFLISCVGVFFNIFIDYPWYDVSYQIAGMDVSSAEMGTTGGYIRYAGFFKSSLQASANVFILLLYLVATSRSKLSIAIYFTFSVLVALITISKTVFVLHLILLIYIFVHFLPVKLIWRCTLLVAVIALIFTITSTNYTFTVRDDVISVMLLGSLDARLTTTWPDGVKTIMQAGTLFFGAGMGTLGVGSKLGNGVYNPGDSMYLYIVGVGGYFLSIIMCIWLYYQSMILDNRNTARYLSILLIVLCLFGISMTVPEYPFMALSLGVVLNSRVYKNIRFKCNE